MQIPSFDDFMFFFICRMLTTAFGLNFIKANNFKQSKLRVHAIPPLLVTLHHNELVVLYFTPIFFHH